MLRREFQLQFCRYFTTSTPFAVCSALPRLHARAARLKKIEIAAFVGLADVLGIKRTVTARVARRRRLPGGAAARELLFGNMQMNAARRHVHLNLVAGLNEGERAADEAFRRHVQD